MMVMPPLLVLLAIWYVVARVKRGGPFNEREWVMLAATIVTALYYKKFLSRADMHIAHSLAPALPLAWFALGKLLEAVAGLARSRWRRVIPVLGAAVVGGVIVATASPGLWQRVAQLRTQYSFALASAPAFERLGWAEPTALSEPVQDWRQIGEFLDAYLLPGDTIFDFTNQPALYHFLLGYKPASRYYNVSMAIRRKTQLDLIAELRRAPPKLVVYDSHTGGLGDWDGVPNVVRHYDISRFLLANYLPLARVAGQTFYILKGLDPTPRKALPPSVEVLQARGGYEAGQQCDWGYSPDFLEPEPMVEGPLFVRGASRVATRIDARGWAARKDLDGPAKELVVTAGGKVVARASTGESRPDVSLALGRGLDGSGFHLVGEWFDDTESPRAEVRLFALSGSGEAQELAVPWPHAAPSEVPIGESLAGARVVHDAVRASVDSAEVSRELVTEFGFPSGMSPDAIAGLELTVRAERAGSVAVSPVPPGESRGAFARPGREIVLRVRRSDRRQISIMVDNCPSWRAAHGTGLFIRSDEGVRVEAVRALLRPAPATSSPG